MKKIKISELKAGMTLNNSIQCDFSYKTLLPKGTKLTRLHLEKLKNINPEGYCFIIEPEDLKGISLETLDKVNNEGVKRAFLDSYITGKSIYQNLACGNPINIKFAYETVDLLTEQLLSHCSLMLQLAAVKVIDEYSFSHMVNVAIYASSFARSLNYSPNAIKDICLAGILHDIGKAKIPQDILQKPGKLTEEEFEIIKRHPKLGYDELNKIQELKEHVRQAVLQHHERANGSGYPLGLKGKEISLYSQVISIADFYDALTSDRCYRGRVLPHEAAEILMGSSSLNDFDIELVRLFLKNITLYPIGTEVVLNTGQRARVVHIPVDFPLRPTLQIMEPDGLDQWIPAGRLELLKETTVFITSIISCS
ncbi:MAG: hypothetical protein CVU88_00925 [Firmicutes bacterium HGW-Firmicutes-13]|nr:MAG: hypothetical protein CVU88_00925 [Firmicutes bacterium HGW-Firmicutes-13]